MNASGGHDDDRSECPDRNELTAFILGKLDDEELRRIGGHLEACQRCENTLLDLDDSGDTMICQLRSVGTVPAYHQAPAYQEFERRVCTVRLGGTATVPDVEALPEQLGPYRIVEFLGRGGMGAVYKAKHVHLGREVALKILPRDRSGDRQYVSRFHAEMEAIGKLDHPHIVRALDAGIVDGRHFLAMEYVAGTDVAEIAGGKYQLPIADACEIVRQAALGLAYIHEHGFVHRDIKPSNLMLTGDGQVKVLDLGVALLRDRETLTDRLTLTNQIVGTADYMAPEQGMGEGRLDRRADLYSLGCVLYRLLTGRTPFDGPQYKTALKKLAGHAHDAPTPLRQYRDGLPNDVERLVERLLAKRPPERFSSAGEVAEELAHYARGADLADLLRRKRPEACGAEELVEPIAPERAREAVHDGRAGTGRRLRTRLLTAALLIVLLATTGGIARYLWPKSRTSDSDSAASGVDIPGVEPRVEGRSSIPVLHEPHFESLAPDQVRRRFLYPLLNVEPVCLRWPEGPLPTRHHFPEIRQLSVSCNGQAMLSMGSVPPVERYTVSVDIHQNQWVGGVGVFFGYQPYGNGTEPAWRYHRLELRQNIGQNRAQFPFVMKRSTVIVRHRADGIRTNEHSLFAVPVGPMARAPQLLEISVVGSRLNRVRWAGRDLHDLCSADVNAGFVAEDYFGQFGLYLYASDAVFRNASITLF